MDETKERTAAAAAEPCAKASNINFSTMRLCFDGADGTALMQKAADTFNAAFPGSTTIPHTFVNDKDTEPDYADLKANLCAAGSTAPACTSHLFGATRKFPVDYCKA